MNDIEQLKDPEGWQECQDNNQDHYGGACVRVAYNVMKKLDEGDPITDIHQLICDADDVGGITGFMAGAVASIVSHCHERGEEFRRIWNGDVAIGDEGERANESGGVLNPAILNIES